VRRALEPVRGEQRADLVAGAMRLRGDPPVLRERVAVEEAEDGLRVADVDREQHARIVRARLLAPVAVVAAAVPAVAVVPVVAVDVIPVSVELVVVSVTLAPPFPPFCFSCNFCAPRWLSSSRSRSYVRPGRPLETCENCARAPWIVPRSPGWMAL
jgi:hypothetical protein